MAKDKPKPSDPFPELAPPPLCAGAADAIPHRERAPQYEDVEARHTASQRPAEDETAALRRRIAELETQLLGKAPLPSGSPASCEDGPPNFEVTVEDQKGNVVAPVVQVRARDQANAWDAYRHKTGMIATENRPRITPLAA